MCADRDSDYIAHLPRETWWHCITTVDFRGNVLGREYWLRRHLFHLPIPLNWKHFEEMLGAFIQRGWKQDPPFCELFLDDKEGKCLITRLALEHRLLLVCVWRSPDNSSRTPESQPDLIWLYLTSPWAHLISRHACAQLFRFLGSVRHLTRLQLRVALWAPFGSSNSSPSWELDSWTKCLREERGGGGRELAARLFAIE